MKITTNKHSASQTGVEQAADAGCMFKCTKQQVPRTNTPHDVMLSISWRRSTASPPHWEEGTHL